MCATRVDDGIGEGVAVPEITLAIARRPTRAPLRSRAEAAPLGIQEACRGGALELWVLAMADVAATQLDPSLQDAEARRRAAVLGRPDDPPRLPRPARPA
jgi:hypothetical protein